MLQRDGSYLDLTGRDASWAWGLGDLFGRDDVGK